jgi:hypothetical protein
MRADVRNEFNQKFHIMFAVLSYTAGFANPPNLDRSKAFISRM